MADFTTHFLCGQQAQSIAPPVVREIIAAQENAYYWGLQGPDPLFFHHASIGNSAFNRLSNLMHLLHTEKLLYHMASYVRSVEDKTLREKLQAYFYGFLCHYALDRRIHPYVYFHQNQLSQDPRFKFSAHIYIEAQLDRYFWRRLNGTNINIFRMKRYYKKDSQLFDGLGQLFADTFQTVYGETADPKELAQCFSETLRYNRLFYSPTGFSYALCKMGDKIGRFHGTLSDHVKRGASFYDFSGKSHTPWNNPWHPEVILHESAWDIFSTAVVESTSLATAFEKYISQDIPVPDHLDLSIPFGSGCPRSDMDKAILRAAR